MGPMIQQTQSTCRDCNGEGKSIAEEKKCKNCSGNGTVKERKVLEVFVQKGVPNQHRITFAGDADQRPNETPGDVVFVVDQLDHPVFTRLGNDLYITKQISLYEALTGFRFLVTHLDDRQLLIQNRPGEIVHPNAVKAVVEEGMPHHKNPFIRGNLYIHFEVQYPKEGELDEDARRKLAQILPVPSRPPINEDDPELEIHYAQHVDKDELKKRSERKEAYDDDDDEGHGGGNPRVQCRQQ